MANEKKGLIDITTGAEVSDANANGILDMSTSEITQLKNIGSSTIDATQWGYVGGLDQSLKTTSNVLHNQISATTKLSATQYLEVGQTAAAPTHSSGYGRIWVESAEDRLHYEDASVAGGDHTLAYSSELWDQSHGSMYCTNNSTDTVINVTGFYHFVTGIMTGSTLENFTFAAGTDDTYSIDITTSDGGSSILCTGATDHGFSVGDEICITNSTSYDNIYQIATVPSSTTFTIVFAYNADRTGYAHMGDRLIAGADVEGSHLISYSGYCVGGSENYYKMMFSIAGTTGTVGRSQTRVYGGGNFSGQAIMYDLTEDDAISFLIANVTDSLDILIYDFQLTVQKL